MPSLSALLSPVAAPATGAVRTGIAKAGAASSFATLLATDAGPADAPRQIVAGTGNQTPAVPTIAPALPATDAQTTLATAALPTGRTPAPIMSDGLAKTVPTPTAEAAPRPPATPAALVARGTAFEVGTQMATIPAPVRSATAAAPAMAAATKQVASAAEQPATSRPAPTVRPVPRLASAPVTASTSIPDAGPVAADGVPALVGGAATPADPNAPAETVSSPAAPTRTPTPTPADPTAGPNVPGAPSPAVTSIGTPRPVHPDAAARTTLDDSGSDIPYGARAVTGAVPDGDGPPDTAPRDALASGAGPTPPALGAMSPILGATPEHRRDTPAIADGHQGTATAPTVSASAPIAPAPSDAGAWAVTPRAPAQPSQAGEVEPVDGPAVPASGAAGEPARSIDTGQDPIVPTGIAPAAIPAPVRTSTGVPTRRQDPGTATPRASMSIASAARPDARPDARPVEAGAGSDDDPAPVADADADADATGRPADPSLVLPVLVPGPAVPTPTPAVAAEPAPTPPEPVTGTAPASGGAGPARAARSVRARGPLSTSAAPLTDDQRLAPAPTPTPTPTSTSTSTPTPASTLTPTPTLSSAARARSTPAAAYDAADPPGSRPAVSDGRLDMVRSLAPSAPTAPSVAATSAAITTAPAPIAPAAQVTTPPTTQSPVDPLSARPAAPVASVATLPPGSAVPVPSPAPVRATTPEPDRTVVPVEAAVVPAALAPSAGPSMPPLPATGAAGRVFAAALHAAAAPAAASRTPAADEDHDPMIAALLAGGSAVQAVPVALAQNAGMDLRHSGWPTRMAEQIEALRDAADATSTSIRVTPDALGPVDLQVRRDGDRVHVHFNAANPETRALIADAQPQLAAAAADRGLKLGQTSVGGDTAGWSTGADGQSAGQGQANQGGTARRTAPAPAPAPAGTLSAASDDAATDTRIA